MGVATSEYDSFDVTCTSKRKWIATHRVETQLGAVVAARRKSSEVFCGWCYPRDVVIPSRDD